MLSEHRDEATATAFFVKTINANGFLHKIVMNNNGANDVGIENINILLMLGGSVCFIEFCPIQYLHNQIEQDHRFIKKSTNP
ncbi:DDE-type integrase/transposase/recombinase [Methylobacter sp. G7]